MIPSRQTGNHRGSSGVRTRPRTVRPTVGSLLGRNPLFNTVQRTSGLIQRKGRILPRGSERYILLVLLFVFSQVVFLQSSVFKLKTIQVTGNTNVSQKKILKQLNLQQGLPIWNYSPKKLAAQVAALREVKAATVSFGLPGRIELSVEERVPVIQVCSASQPNSWFAVDFEGIVLRPIQSQSCKLPRLMVTEPLNTQSRIHPKTLELLANAIRVLDPALANTVWYYVVDAQGSLQVKTFANRAVVKVLLGDIQSASQKGLILQALQRRLATEFANQKPTVIDLRTTSPAVRFQRVIDPASATAAVPATPNHTVQSLPAPSASSSPSGH